MTGAGYAIFSPCRTWRYLLMRHIQQDGPLFAYFGVNGSTADETEEDQTTKKWLEFTRRAGGRGYLAANPFAYTATDVRELGRVEDPVGPDNHHYILRALEEADILVPCWGSRAKIPRHLWPELDKLRRMIGRAGKPVLVFGITQTGDPMHPLMLGYSTPLVDWDPELPDLI